MRVLTLLKCAAIGVAGWTAGCGQTAQTGQTSAPSGPVLYEGARLIVGDGSAAIENGVFLVEGGRIGALGPRGAVSVPAGAARVDLSGKTVMPTLVNGHMHPGYEGSPANNYANLRPENWTPENLLAHLQREAYLRSRRRPVGRRRRDGAGAHVRAGPGGREICARRPVCVRGGHEPSRRWSGCRPGEG